MHAQHFHPPPTLSSVVRAHACHHIVTRERRVCECGSLDLSPPPGVSTGQSTETLYAREHRWLYIHTLDREQLWDQAMDDGGVVHAHYIGHEQRELAQRAQPATHTTSAPTATTPGSSSMMLIGCGGAAVSAVHRAGVGSFVPPLNYSTSEEHLSTPCPARAGCTSSTWRSRRCSAPASKSPSWRSACPSHRTASWR